LSTIDVTYEPITINSGPVTVDVTGLNDINATLTIPQPIETDTTLTLKTPDTFNTDNHLESTSSIDTKSAIDTTSAIDLRPVAIDQCLRLSLAPLPATHICYPNRQRIALSLFGVEVFGLTLEGEAQVVVGEPRRQTQIVGGEARALHETHEPRIQEIGGGDSGGGAPRLKIRLGG
jgi:hypothetical protein